MRENEELAHAWDFIENTNTSIFLTGKAGTGKTTFLRTLKEHSNKRIVVLAPTGVAAINAQGVTIHSFFQLPFTPFVPEMNIRTKFDFSKEKRKIIKTLDLLIIDEISMVRADVLDAIDSVMRRFRDYDKPFGGVQLLMIGDLQQLTPVVTPQDESILRQHYPTPYFFSSKALALINYVTIELTTVFRQQDPTFIHLLNNIREGKLATADRQLLNTRYNPDFKPQMGSDYILLTTHNNIADNYNTMQLVRIAAQSYSFVASTKGTFSETSYPAENTLTLKKGAQVMFIRNDSNGLYYNGKIGHVVGISKESIFVKCPNEAHEIEVKQEVWENTKYTLNEKTKQIEPEVQGTFTQYPLRLAWAITIHKSQGLTFEHAIIDAGKSFAAGQVYVALSRCKSIEGLVLKSLITEGNIINDEQVDQYMASQAQIANKQVHQLETLKQEYYRTLVLELFSFDDIARAEVAMHRLLNEHFYKQQAIIALHNSCITDFASKLQTVADKWRLLVEKMTFEQLNMPDFIERIKKGALYFHANLTELFSTLLTATKEVAVNNKVLAKRFETAYSELEQTVLAKRYLLEDMTAQAFSTAYYLRAKQEAVVASMGKDEQAQKKRRKKKEAEKKEPKQPTATISFQLYKEGKTIEQIAKERSLTTNTIMTHLGKFVAEGLLPITDILPQNKINVIKEAVQRITLANGMKPIKEACPDYITYGDIHFYISSTHNNNKK